MRRRGFTLVELVMALVLLGLVATVLTKVFISQQRLTVAQVEQASMQANVRTGTRIVANELVELSSNALSGSDIITFTATDLVYRGMRSLALACRVTSGSVRVRTTPIYGARPITAGRDSMLLFVEHDSTTASDDEWVALPITGVSSSTCLDGSPALRLASAGIPSAGEVQLDAPVRTYEIMEVAPVIAGVHNWLGARSVTAGEELTPVAGPITLAGLSFNYLDSLGAETATRSRIRSIRITLRGQTDWNILSLGTGLAAAPLRDSLVTTVTLRNVARP
jgi:prepilin-type N-terminal cleavage/methylation domain-containing protein